MDAEHEFVEQLRTATETYLQSADEWEASYAKYYCLHVSTNTGLPSLSLETPSAASWFSTSSVPNQISGWTYDASGNVTAVGSMSRSFTYDAENRQTGATISGASYTYAYDGVGNRISSTDSGQTTVYAFDASGNLAVEYGQTGFGLCGTATCYLTVDHLGSTRLMTDSSGAVTRRFDYLPFGEQLPASTNNRSSAGYLATADQLRAKFTGQQHDGTGLDFFNARYLSGAQGRFTSADPGNAGAILGDPQSWNGYAYVNNNPLTYTDPSGMDGGGFSLCAGGPVACGIGIGIDIGIVLWKIFGSGGGGSARPTVPNTQPGGGSANCGGPLGGCGSAGGDPWNEKVPFGLSGGGLNTGSVFGSGNTSPFVFSFADASESWIQKVPTVPGWLVNGVAGAGDKFTTIPFTNYSLTALTRNHTPGGDGTSPSSTSYSVGGYLGTGFQIIFTSVAGGTMAAIADGKNGAYFGRGTASVFNTGKVRFGWYWEVNRDAIGLRIGAAKGTSWYSHFPFWYPK